jgi:hypothetical protein
MSNFSKTNEMAEMYYKVGFISPVFCGIDKINSPPTPSCWNNSCLTKGNSLCRFPNNQFQARLFYPRYDYQCNKINKYIICNNSC